MHARHDYCQSYVRCGIRKMGVTIQLSQRLTHQPLLVILCVAVVVVVVAAAAVQFAILVAPGVAPPKW